jgi:hypothetical protein
MKRHFSSALGLLALSLATMACAEDIEPSNTTVSGFGTLGAVYDSNDKYGFIRDLGQVTTPGRQYSLATDTRLGIQVAHTFNQQWQAVGQVLLRDQAEQTLDSSVTRAFVSYRPTANLHLRFGRMADATFLMSDYLDVGYAYPWVRPPVESYGLVVPRSYDGADATYSLPDASGVWRIKGLVGQVKAAIPTGFGDNYILETNDAMGLALIREQGPLKARVGYSTLHLKNSFPIPIQLTSGLSQMMGNPAINAFYPAISSEARSLLDDLSGTQGARIGYASVGVTYDDGKWVAQVELSELTSQTKLAPRGQQGFVSLGYRTGDFLPYVMISGARAPALAKAGTSWGDTLAGTPFGSAAASLQNGALAAINSTRMAQSTLSLGMRWDFDSRAALKLQWDHVRVQDNGWRLWTSSIGSDSAANSANVLSASIDFVF